MSEVGRKLPQSRKQEGNWSIQLHG